MDNSDPSFVYVDAHVLATPVLVDYNEDGVVSELIVPVSYYYDPYHYRSAIYTVSMWLYFLFLVMPTIWINLG